MTSYQSSNRIDPVTGTDRSYHTEEFEPDPVRSPTLVASPASFASGEASHLCESDKSFSETFTSTTTTTCSTIIRETKDIKPVPHPMILKTAASDAVAASPPSTPLPTIVEALHSRPPGQAPLPPSNGRNWLSTLLPSNSIVSRFFVDTLHLDEWNQDASVIMAAVFSSWLLTRMGGGFLGCFIIGGFLATYYKRAIRRMRRDARDDLERELTEARALEGVETADWLNHFVQRFWLIYEPILSAQTIVIADAILIESTPAFLDSIRLSTFTLGNRPFRIKNIKTYPRTEPNVVCMDWTISFNPNDTLDLTQAELKKRTRPKIVLTIRVGKGMIGAEMPVLLEDLEFSGKVRLTFKLFNEFPHIKTVQASFLEKPQFDYALKPVGGEKFGFDINNIPGLQTFLQDQVHATLGPMMYAPNVYTLDVAGMMEGTTDTYSANGVLAITVHSASNLKEVDLLGTMDPYITFHLGNVRNPELGRTSAHEDTTDPRWNETHFVLLNKLAGTLYLQVMDRNSGRKDTVVGVAHVSLQEVADADNKHAENLKLIVLRSGKPAGQVKCDMRYLEVSKPTKVDGIIVPPPDSNSGILQLVVHECRDLGDSDTNAYAIVKVDGQEKRRTKVFKRSGNPHWNKMVEIFVDDRATAELEVTIVDSKEFSDDEVIGTWRIGLYDLLFFRRDIEWWHLKSGRGKLHMTSVWKPVARNAVSGNRSPTSPTGATFLEGYMPPIGVVRIQIYGARGLKNVEALTGGKSDPYVRVLSGMQVRGQTERRDDDLDPDWDDAILYIPVHSIRDTLTFEIMDFNSIASDESLGVYDFAIKQIVERCPVVSPSEATLTAPKAMYYHRARDPVDMWVDIHSPEQRIAGADDDAAAAASAKGGQGRLHFAASFIPPMDLPKDEQGHVVFADIDLHGERVNYKEESGSTSSKKVDLLSYESGILCVTVHEANLKTRSKAAIDVFVDSNDSQYSTSELKGGRLVFNETGDAFVKELDFSRLTVRARPARDCDKDDVTLGYYNLPAREIVRNIMEKGPGVQQEYRLVDGEGSTVRLSFDYIPVVGFVLDPAESLENQGNLTVTAISAANVPAVDRSGTSDPYLRFYVGDHKVHKTQVYKKQLNPVFHDESFTVPIPNRVGLKLMVEMYDWDQIGKDRLLCRCQVAFGSDELESFAARNMTVAMEKEGNAENAKETTIKLRLLWQPQLLARKKTSTTLLLSQTTRIFTSAPGALFDVGKTAIKRIGTSGSIELPNASSPHHEPVTFQVTLVEAKGLKAMDRGGTSDPYVRFSINNMTVYKSKTIKKTVQPEWNETFTAKITNDITKPAKMRVHVVDWNAISDDDIGDCSFNMWELLKPGETAYDGWISLRPEGRGEVHLRVELV
ncbi:C2 domain-containing protein [Dichotomocladium elegans]|nr:C2 domain-containing protein [Dichotomocladium elegans]